MAGRRRLRGELSLAERMKNPIQDETEGSLSSPAPLAPPESKVSLKDLLKSEEVAHLTGLSIETLAQWRSQRRGIPYLKIGRSVRYARADVQAYLEGCRVSVSVPKERRQN